MTETNAPLREARALPKGAKFYRCAFQVNPAGYAQKFRGNGHGLDERTYVQKLLDRCVELDVEVIAVTDHNDATLGVALPTTPESVEAGLEPVGNLVGSVLGEQAGAAVDQAAETLAPLEGVT